MASGTLGVKLKKEINEAVDRLLGRAKRHLVSPISDVGMEKWWNCSIDPEIVAAIDLLKAKRYHLHGVTSGFQTVIISLASGYVELVVHQTLMRHPILMKGNGHDEQDRIDCGDALLLNWPHTSEMWGRMQSWLETIAQVDTEFKNAHRVCRDLVEMCGTAGQLNRAMPELASVLPQRCREALHGQKRASGMPFEYAPYDKACIDRGQFALLKAHMMPESDGRDWTDQVTWVHSWTR